jgi:hypothetical protein
MIMLIMQYCLNVNDHVHLHVLVSCALVVGTKPLSFRDVTQGIHIPVAPILKQLFCVQTEFVENYNASSKL